MVHLDFASKLLKYLSTLRATSPPDKTFFSPYIITSASAARVLNCEGEKYFNPYLARSAESRRMEVITASVTFEMNAITTKLLISGEFPLEAISLYFPPHMLKQPAIRADKTEFQIISFTNNIVPRKSEIAYQHNSEFK